MNNFVCNLNRLPNLASYNNYEIKKIKAYYISYELTNYLPNNIVNISRCVNYVLLQLTRVI